MAYFRVLSTWHDGCEEQARQAAWEAEGGPAEEKRIAKEWTLRCMVGPR